MTFKQYLLAAGVLLAAGNAAAADLRKVSLAFGSPWNASNGEIAFGIALGFFKEEGIEIDPIAVQGAGVMVPQLAQGKIDFGMPPPDFLMIAADKGERFPVKMFLNTYSAQPFEFVVEKTSPLNTIGDLKGRKLGVGALSWGNLPMTRVFLKESGVVWDKDVTPVPTGVGPAAWQMLTTKQVDALNLFVHQHEMMQLQGIEIKRLPLPEKYKSLFGNGYAASDKMLADEPKLVESMARAITRSQIACRAQPVNCARSYWAFDPSTRPAAGEEATWLKTYGAINAAGQSKIHAFQTDGRFGEYRSGDWKALTAAMAEGGQIKSADLDVSGLYTNAFVTKANDFDMAKTLAAAAAYK